MTLDSDCVIIGSVDDAHTSAVAKHLNEPTLIDVSSLQHEDISVTDDGALCVGSRHLRAQRGWIRRVMPPGWTIGAVAGSRQARRQAAWLVMLVSYIRASDTKWLSELDDLVAAESKLLLAKTARSARIPTPRAVVARTPSMAARLLKDSRIVAKPLGPSLFGDSERLKTIPTSDVSDLVPTELAPEAFLYQPRIEAQRCFRVVTVDMQTWVFVRSVKPGEPLDWRYSPEAHGSFERCDNKRLGRHAVEIANALGIGYSSQDWLDDGDTTWIVDVNPAGQWLFLPDGDEIAEAIASWLCTTG